MDKYFKSKFIQAGGVLIITTLLIGFFQPDLATNEISLERNTAIIRGLTGISVVLFAIGWYKLRQKASRKK